MTVTAPTPPQPWSIPSGATNSQTIVQLQTDRPLAVVTCTSGKVRYTATPMRFLLAEFIPSFLKQMATIIIQR